jgi:hypothetical protein
VEVGLEAPPPEDGAGAGCVAKGSLNDASPRPAKAASVAAEELELVGVEGAAPVEAEDADPELVVEGEPAGAAVAGADAAPPRSAIFSAP